MIIRAGRAFDTAEQNETGKTPSSLSHVQQLQMGSSPRSQFQPPETGGELLINEPVARNMIEIRTSVQRAGSLLEPRVFNYRVSKLRLSSKGERSRGR